MIRSSPHDVLLVDDDDAFRDALAMLLTVEGFDVAPAWGVEDAYRHLRQGFRPCVVVIDLHMPGPDGWDFLDRMESEPDVRDVPVIVISGDADQRHRVNDRQAAFLSKPMAPAVLVQEIRRHCRRHRPTAA